MARPTQRLQVSPVEPPRIMQPVERYAVVNIGGQFAFATFANRIRGPVGIRKLPPVVAISSLMAIALETHAMRLTVRLRRPCHSSVIRY